MATAYNSTLNYQTMSTNALWRTTIQLVSNCLQAGGFTKRGDTGQIDTATVTKPVGDSTVSGYEIRQMTDTLAATAPVVMKIEYSTGNTAQNIIFFLTFGTGSDGAGNITGIFAARGSIIMGNNSGSSSAKVRVAAGTNYFVLAMAYDTAINSNGQMLYAIERTRNNAGAVDNVGIYHGGNFGNSNTLFAAANNGFKIVPFSGVAPSQEANGDAIIPSADSGLAGVDVGIFPLNPSNFGYKTYAPHVFMCYVVSTLTTDAQIPVDVDGTVKQYQTTGLANAMSAKGNHRGMFLFE